MRFDRQYTVASYITLSCYLGSQDAPRDTTNNVNYNDLSCIINPSCLPCTDFYLQGSKG